MHQPDFDVSSVRPPVLAGATPGWFKEGDEVSNILGSILTAGFMNDLLGNLLNIKEITGLPWTKGEAGDGDLAAMIMKLIFAEFSDNHVRFGNGYMIQWSLAQLPTGNSDNVSMPYGFPNAFLHVMCCDAAAGCFVTSAAFNGTSRASFLGSARNPLAGGAFTTAFIRYVAIGR